MNYFAVDGVSERYSDYRPVTHSAAISEIASFLELSEPVDCAVDVGCGTGISTIPLLEIARRAIGIDASHEMLTAGLARDGISYIVGCAENLPLADSCCDLVTICSAWTWLDGPDF